MNINKKIILIFLILGIVTSIIIFKPQSEIIKIENAYISGKLIKIKAMKSGVVSEVLASRGSWVYEGQPLVKLDNSEALIDLERKEIVYASSLNSSLADCIEKGFHNKEVAINKLNLKINNMRRKSRDILLRKNMISKEDYLQFEFLEKISQIELQKSKLASEIQSVGKGYIASLEDTARIAKLDVRKAAFELFQHSTFSPANAYLYDMLAYEGDKIDEGDVIAILVQQDNLMIQANVLEDELKNIMIGQPVSIHIDIYKNERALKGRVHSIVPAAASVFSPLPINNTDSTWVKVRQRVPILVSIDDEWKKYYKILPLGVSVEIFIDTKAKRYEVQGADTLESDLDEEPRWHRESRSRLKKILNSVEESNQHLKKLSNCRLIKN